MLLALAIAPADLKDNSLPFDTVRWKGANPRTRGQMVSSLLKQHREVLLGKSTVEIKGLLSEPDLEGNNFLSYHFESGFLLER